MSRGVGQLSTMVSTVCWMVLLSAGCVLADEAAEQGSGDTEHSETSAEAAHAEGEEHAGEEHAGEEHAGGEHHDPFDLSHQNATDDLEDVMSFKTDLAIWTFVIFLCLLALLGKFAWGPITAALDQREQSIASMIEEAKQSNEKAAAQLKEYEARLAAAGEEARQILAQGRRDAEEAGERLRSQAQDDAERDRQRAVADIENAKNVALQEMTQRSVDLATLMAGRMLQRQLNPEDHSQLIREALDQLPSRN